jgi:hypothetical protein
VAGLTHYRGKGFTFDPNTWDEYFSRLTEVLNDPRSALLTEAQVDEAWHYAYCFFFEYPQPFPWHLLHFWKDIEINPLSEVIGRQGQGKYSRAFRYLLGELFEWDANDR